MKEHPIIFSGPMVKAILEGRKTQTRRALRIQPLDVLPMKVPNEWVSLMTREPEPHGTVFKCRHGIPGDRLWVRESFVLNYSRSMPVAYKADWHIDTMKGIALPPKWKPSIHMPRWASRITLEIVNVRVERVQDIKYFDIRDEGLPPYTNVGGKDVWIEKQYRDLWDSLNAKRGFGWDANPWVWVIEFNKQ